MKISMLTIAGVVSVALVVGFVSCRQKTETPGPAEKAGAALDRAAAKTADAANTAAEKTKEAAVKAADATKSAAQKVVEKTGEGLEKAGEAVENTGVKMQQ